MNENNIVEKKKTKRRVLTGVFWTVIAVLVGVLSYSLYMFFSEYIPQQREQGRFAELRELIEEDDDPYEPTDAEGKPADGAAKKGNKYRKLFEMNSDMVGWLKVPDTQIDYPVMKTDLEDGEYYLHRDFDGYYSFAGCLFIGKGCDADSDVFVIYGHNMNSGAMFGNLDSYMYYDYAFEHRDIIFDTRSEYRVYRVFAAFSTQIFDENSTEYKYYESIGDFDDQEYDSIVSNIYDLSYIDLGSLPRDHQQIMLLSTCAYHTENGRFVVAAYRIK